MVKWAVAESMLPAENYTAIKCVESLKKGRPIAKETEPITCVATKLVDATLSHRTKVLSDMVRFQQLTGCRPRELCSIKAGRVDRSGQVWQITLDRHKTTHRGRERIIYVGPKAQAVLAPYLLRGQNDYCFSPIESERQRRAARTAARRTPPNQGNRAGQNLARKPRVAPREHYTADTYRKAIYYACRRAKLRGWPPIHPAQILYRRRPVQILEQLRQTLAQAL
jgi:integrase